MSHRKFSSNSKRWNQSSYHFKFEKDLFCPFFRSKLLNIQQRVQFSIVTGVSPTKWWICWLQLFYKDVVNIRKRKRNGCPHKMVIQHTPKNTLWSDLLLLVQLEGCCFGSQGLVVIRLENICSGSQTRKA